MSVYLELSSLLIPYMQGFRGMTNNTIDFKIHAFIASVLVLHDVI